MRFINQQAQGRLRSGQNPTFFFPCILLYLLMLIRYKMQNKMEEWDVGQTGCWQGLCHDSMTRTSFALIS